MDKAVSEVVAGGRDGSMTSQLTIPMGWFAVALSPEILPGQVEDAGLLRQGVRRLARRGWHASRNRPILPPPRRTPWARR
jgi:hypothetical protein